MAGPGDATLARVSFDDDAVPRVGLIALSTDMTSERDAARVLPGAGIALHTTRVAFENPTTPESLLRMQPRLGEAAALIVPGVPLAAIWYSCTAASAIIGDEPVEAAIATGRPGVPVVTPPVSARAAFRRLGVGRIAVLTPYLARTTEGLVGYFEEAGLDIVSTMSLGIEDDRDMARVGAGSILSAAGAANHPDAEALFISCTALPAMALIGDIEATLGKPVITSNQACLWRLGELSGRPVQGPGRLFATPNRTEAA